MHLATPKKTTTPRTRCDQFIRSVWQGLWKHGSFRINTHFNHSVKALNRIHFLKQTDFESKRMALENFMYPKQYEGNTQHMSMQAHIVILLTVLFIVRIINKCTMKPGKFLCSVVPEKSYGIQLWLLCFPFNLPHLFSFHTLSPLFLFELTSSYKDTGHIYRHHNKRESVKGAKLFLNKQREWKNSWFGKPWINLQSFTMPKDQLKLRNGVRERETISHLPRSLHFDVIQTGI